MARSLSQQVRELVQFRDDFLAGAFPARSMLGPGALQKNVIRSKSITTGMLDVDQLSSVSSNTGNLTVTGSMVMSGLSAVVRAGLESWSDSTNEGWWLGYDNTYPKLIIGRRGASSHMLEWDGELDTLTITGVINAKSGGTIGGWSIGATTMSAGTGTSYITISSAGGTTPVFSAGAADPTAAPFRVLNSGAATLTNATISGGTLGDITINGTDGLIMGTAGTTRGISTGATTFYAGSATPAEAPFRVTSAGVMTATGATIKTGSGTNRFEVNSSGVHIYNDVGVRVAYFNTTGAGRIASTADTDETSAIYWDTAGTATINASAITTGTLNASTITVSNINASNINTGTLNGSFIEDASIADSKVAALSANKITAGTGVINALTVKSTLTLGTDGVIVDSDGSYWDKDGIVLKGALDDILFSYGGGTVGGLGQSVGVYVELYQGATAGVSGVRFYSNEVYAYAGATGRGLYAGSSLATVGTGVTDFISINSTGLVGQKIIAPRNQSDGYLDFQNTSIRLYNGSYFVGVASTGEVQTSHGGFYPGNAGTTQTTVGIGYYSGLLKIMSPVVGTAGTFNSYLRIAIGSNEYRIQLYNP